MSYNKETGMYEGYIYKIVNDVNRKIYIGQTRRDVDTRFKEHCKGANITNKKKIQVIDYAINKYGKDNFSMDVLKFLSCETEPQLLKELKQHEIYYIEKYNSRNNELGYNITKGGDSCAYYQEKAVWQYSKDGEFIREYKSLNEAALYNNLSKQDISHCCHKTRGVCVGGFMWSFKGESYRTDTYMRNRKVFKYDLEGNLIEIYDCINDITDNKKLRHKITNCCSGYTYNIDGFVYRYMNDAFNKFQVLPKKQGGHTMQKCPVIQYDLNWNIINKFNSIKEAHEITKINKCGITDCCKNRRESIFNYRFQYDLK